MHTGYVDVTAAEELEHVRAVSLERLERMCEPPRKAAAIKLNLARPVGRDDNVA